MFSDVVKKGPARAPARAMLRATGLSGADIERPLVAVANTWTEVTPCNLHLRRLAAKVKEGIRAAGGTPIEFNTIAISDGISMGTDGMRASLISREVVADSIELFVLGHSLDAVVAISGCDKTIPGTVMALARLDLPSLALYGGSIQPGSYEGHDITIQDVFEAVGSLRRREDGREGASGDRGAGLPGRGGVRRPVHGEHDGDGPRVPRHLADGSERRPRHRPAEGRRRVRVRRARDGAPRQEADAPRRS